MRTGCPWGTRVASVSRGHASARRAPCPAPRAASTPSATSRRAQAALGERRPELADDTHLHREVRVARSVGELGGGEGGEDEGGIARFGTVAEHPGDRRAGDDVDRLLLVHIRDLDDRDRTRACGERFEHGRGGREPGLVAHEQVPRGARRTRRPCRGARRRRSDRRLTRRRTSAPPDPPRVRQRPRRPPARRRRSDGWCTDG